uniref:Uncharacterized protein n=1 Tax=Rhizophora mucronata TaxID=61149 RepID=A0A2P2R4I7_RHIMU
MPIFGCWDV